MRQHLLPVLFLFLAISSSSGQQPVAIKYGIEHIDNSLKTTYTERGSMRLKVRDGWFVLKRNYFGNGNEKTIPHRYFKRNDTIILSWNHNGIRHTYRQFTLNFGDTVPMIDIFELGRSELKSVNASSEFIGDTIVESNGNKMYCHVFKIYSGLAVKRKKRFDYTQEETVFIDRRNFFLVKSSVVYYNLANHDVLDIHTTTEIEKIKYK